MAKLDVTAILLCGGKGERLRPFTESMPKPLVPLNGQPLLLHLMRYLSQGGVRRFVCCTGYKAEAIEAFVKENPNPQWDVRCVNSGDASMTDRILDALPHVTTRRCIVCYGDTLANVDVAELLEAHEQSGAIATLTVYPMRSPFGVVEFDETGKIRRFLEKPVLPHWLNIGFLVLEPAAMKLLKRGADMVGFLDDLVATGQFHVHRHTGKHLTVNTEKERAQAEAEMVEFFTLLDGQVL
jgi:glucose-1-phosphate cytidylyltransferase